MAAGAEAARGAAAAAGRPGARGAGAPAGAAGLAEALRGGGGGLLREGRLLEAALRRGSGDAGLFAACAKSLLLEGSALARPSGAQRHVLARWALVLLGGIARLPEDALPPAARAKAAQKLAEFLAGLVGELLLEEGGVDGRAWQSLARGAGRVLSEGGAAATDALLAAAGLAGPPGAGAACLLADALPSLRGGGRSGEDRVLAAVLKSWSDHASDVKAAGYKALAPRLGRVLQGVGAPALGEGAVPALLRLLKRSPDNALVALNALLEGQAGAGTDLSPVATELLDAVMPQLKHSAADNRDAAARALGLLAARVRDPDVAESISSLLVAALSGKKEKLKNANEKAAVLAALAACGSSVQATAVGSAAAAAAVRCVMGLHAAESNEQLVSAALEAVASWGGHLESLPDGVAAGLAAGLGAGTAEAVRLSAFKTLLRLVTVEKFRPQLVVAAKPLGVLVRETLTKGAMNTLGASAVLALEKLRRGQDIAETECDVQGLLVQAFADGSPLLAEGYVLRLSASQQEDLAALLQEALLNHPEKLSEPGRAAVCSQLGALCMSVERRARLAALATIQNCVPDGGSELVQTMALQLVRVAANLRPEGDGEMCTAPPEHWGKAVLLAISPDDLTSLTEGALVGLLVCAHHPLVNPAGPRAQMLWRTVTARHFASTGKRFCETVQISGHSLLVALLRHLVDCTEERGTRALLASIAAVTSECPEFLFPVLLNKLREAAPLEEHKSYSKRDFKVSDPALNGSPPNSPPPLFSLSPPRRQPQAARAFF